MVELWIKFKPNTSESWARDKMSSLGHTTRVVDSRKSGGDLIALAYVPRENKLNYMRSIRMIVGVADVKVNNM